MKNIRGLLISCLSGALVVMGILGWRIVQGPGAATPGAKPEYLNVGLQTGSVSMRSVVWS
ncbi:MAG: hypothetical protein ACO26I_07795 [Burkholderiaceae bacterium]